jgi:hypothetical protein
VLFWGQIANKNHRKSVKKVSFEKKHGLVLLFKKNHQKTARDLSLDRPKITPTVLWRFFMAKNAYILALFCYHTCIFYT